MNKLAKNKYFLASIIFIILFSVCLKTDFFALGEEEVSTFNSDLDGSYLNDEIKGLNDQIQTKKDLIKKRQDQQEALKRALAQKQAEKADLTNQLAILDNRMEKSQIDIENAQLEIDKTMLEIKKIDLQIADRNSSIEKEKDNIAETMNLMYKEDGVTSLEIILLNKSLSDFLNQVKYLENINSEIKNSLTNLYSLKAQLEKDKAAQVEKGKELDKQKLALQDGKNQIESEQETKTFVLDQTKSSEAEYQRLIKLAKQEQERASSDIYNLEKSVREKLSKMTKDELEFNDNGFIWPVTKNTVTAYFHDPDYPFRAVFEHPAVDIRASQGSTIRAAASGYVARAKDAGKGYSYIMIVHGNGLSTVYGHVSRIAVSEDEFVTQGQTIGASGGLPGTPGAGPMTTGAHLHFEVRLNGIPVNPLEYLP